MYQKTISNGYFDPIQPPDPYGCGGFGSVCGETPPGPKGVRPPSSSAELFEPRRDYPAFSSQSWALEAGRMGRLGVPSSISRIDECPVPGEGCSGTPLNQGRQGVSGAQRAACPLALPCEVRQALSEMPRDASRGRPRHRAFVTSSGCERRSETRRSGTSWWRATGLGVRSAAEYGLPSRRDPFTPSCSGTAECGILDWTE